MPFPLTLTTPDGATAHQLTVPTKWADVSLQQFVQLFAPEPGATYRPAELLCGLEAGGLDDLAASDVAYIGNLLAFAADPADVLELLPSAKLPDIGSLPYGCLLLAQAHMQEQPERPILAYGPYILALYRVQLAYGKVDFGKLEACLAALLAAPVTESYGDLAHFLTGLSSWLSGTPQTQKTQPTQRMKKRKLVQNIWRNVLGRS